jgi:hypothetical protein
VWFFLYVKILVTLGVSDCTLHDFVFNQQWRLWHDKFVGALVTEAFGAWCSNVPIHG